MEGSATNPHPSSRAAATLEYHLTAAWQRHSCLLHRELALAHLSEDCLIDIQFTSDLESATAVDPTCWVSKVEWITQICVRGVWKVQVESHCSFVLVEIGRHKCQSNTWQFVLGLLGPHLIDDLVYRISGSDDSEDEMGQMEDHMHYNAEIVRDLAREGSLWPNRGRGWWSSDDQADHISGPDGGSRAYRIVPGRVLFDQIEDEVRPRFISWIQFILDHPQTTSISDETGRRNNQEMGGKN